MPALLRDECKVPVTYTQILEWRTFGLRSLPICVSERLDITLASCGETLPQPGFAWSRNIRFTFAQVWPCPYNALSTHYYSQMAVWKLIPLRWLTPPTLWIPMCKSHCTSLMCGRTNAAAEDVCSLVPPKGQSSLKSTLSALPRSNSRPHWAGEYFLHHFSPNARINYGLINITLKRRLLLNLCFCVVRNNTSPSWSETKKEGWSMHVLCSYA